MDSSSHRRPSRRARSMVLVLLAVAVGGGVWFLKTHSPSESDLLPSCPFHKLTGWHCPGCGGTRALHALLNGDIAQAHAWNVLILPILFVVGGSLARSLWAWHRGAPVSETSLPRRRWWILLAVLAVVYTVLRNLPAFADLAPHPLAN